MSDEEKKPARKPLTLKGAQPGEVKQTFSHGRTNKVAVEVKRRRKLVKPGEAAPAPAPAPAPAAAASPTPPVTSWSDHMPSSTTTVTTPAASQQENCRVKQS